MDFSRFLSIKDFFNYYIAGMIWSADLLLLINMKNIFLNPNWTILESIQWNQTIFEIIIVVVIPYTIGFALQPLSAWMTKKIRDEIIGDPIKCITNVENHCNDNYCNGRYYKGKHLTKPAIDRIFKIAPDIFGYSIKGKNKYADEQLREDKDRYKEEHLWFYQIRAYVLDNGGPSVNLAERAQSLANFTESLMLPFPILCSIVTWIMINRWYNHASVIACFLCKPLPCLIMIERLNITCCISVL
jgi:hypothetical protein